MTAPDKKQPTPPQHKPALTTPVQKADRPGHPAPKPPPDATQPAATTPKEPLANALLGVSETVSAPGAVGRMGTTNSDPQVPTSVSNPSSVRMTKPVEEPTDENAERTGESAAKSGTQKPPQKQPPPTQAKPPPPPNKR